MAKLRMRCILKSLKALKKGFTLVELVIVIAVIAVLSAVLVPVFGDVIQESRISALKSNLKTCSSNLIMYAQSAGIDYYTVSDVKEYLESSGISTTDPVYDGYSIWYNQKNMNFSLIKNKDLSKRAKSATAELDGFLSNLEQTYCVNGTVAALNAAVLNTAGQTASTAYNSNVTLYASGADQLGTSKVDKLGRRPEALTSDKNLLFINGDKSANEVKQYIKNIYTLADAENRDEALNSDSFITKLNNNLNSVSIMKQIDWDIADYVECFNPSKTAWLAKDGNWYTNSTDGRVDNIIVSSNLGDEYKEDGFEGTLKDFKGDQLINGVEPIKLTTACAIEIATASEIKLGDNFFTNINEGVNNIFYVGKVTVSNTAQGGASGGQNVITAAGGIAGKINSAVSSGDYSIISGGGSGSKNQYVSVSFSSGKSKFGTPQQALNYLYSVTESEKYDANGNVTSGANGEETYEKLFYRLSNGKIAYDLVKSSQKEAWYSSSTVGSGENTQTAQFKFVAPTVSLNLKNFAEEYDIKEIRSFILKETECFGYHTVSLFGTFEENPKDGQSEGTIKGITFNLGVGYINYFDDKTFVQQDENGKNVYHEIQGASAEDKTNAGSLLISLPSGADKLNDYTDENLYITVKYKNATNYYMETKSTFGASIIGDPIRVEKSETSSVISLKASAVKKSDGTYLINFGNATAVGFEIAGSATHYANFADIESITFSIKNGSQEKILLVKCY